MLYLHFLFPQASPIAISGRTSYSQARLAFHILPQLIPEFCTTHGFGLPPAFRRNSPWPWQARLASGLAHSLINALLTLDFSMPPSQKDLDQESARTRWCLLQKVRRHPAEAGLRLFVSKWFQVLFHRDHLPTFHLSLTVLVHYR